MDQSIDFRLPRLILRLNLNTMFSTADRLSGGSVRFNLPILKRHREAATPPSTGGVRVSDLAAGQHARVVQTLGGESELAYLKALGIEPGAEVRVCRAGSPCVLGLGLACGGSCRIGIGRDMARRIVVECTCERAGIDDPVL